MAPVVPVVPGLVVFVVALSLRLLHLFLMHGTPYFSVLMGDARGYDAWAREIAAGDWIGREVFYQAPLYPYFVGVVYTIFGDNLLALRVAQAIVGSLSCVLLAYAGARWFSPRAGLLSGLILAFYAPAIFFDGIVQKSVLDVFFMCAALAILGSTRPGVVSRVRTAKRNPVLFCLGIVIGCLALTRENALLLVPVVGLWVVYETGFRFPGRLSATKPGFVFLLGVILTLAPVAVRNYAVGGGFYLTTSQFGPNFYIGNNPQADGTYMSLRFGRGSPEYERIDATELAERALGRTLTPAEVSSYWTDRAMAFVTSQPGSWLRLQARKVALLVNATEMVDTESQEVHAEYSWPLRLLSPFAHFGILVPLAVFGLVLTWPDRKRLWVLYAIALTYALSTIAFYVFARYRYPLTPLLVLFASAGLVCAWQSWRPIKGRPTNQAISASSQSVRRAPLYGAPVALIAALVVAIGANWPMLSVDRMRAITDTNLGTAFYEQGQLPEAVEQYRQAIAIQPDYVPAYNNLGVALRAQGHVVEAIETYQQGLRLRDEYPDLHFNLANALMEQNRADEAAAHLQVASAVSADSAAVHNNLGKALAEKGQLAEAVKEFEIALTLEPDSIQAHRNLGSVLPSLGRAAEALGHLQRAVEIDGTDPDARYDLGSLWLERGRFEDAARELAAAVAARPGYVEARNNLGIALASQGKLKEAIAQWEEALLIRPDFEDARRNLQRARQVLR